MNQTTPPDPTLDASVWKKPVLIFFAALGGAFCIGSLLILIAWLLFSGSSDRQQQAANLPNPTATRRNEKATEPNDKTNESAKPSNDESNPASTDNQNSVQAEPASKTSASKTSAAKEQPPNTTDTVPTPDPGAIALRPFLMAKLPPHNFSKDRYRSFQSYFPDYAYAPPEGTLGIQGPWRREIGFIDKDVIDNGTQESPVKLVKLSGEPVGIGYKPNNNGGVFVAAYASPGGVVLIDPVTFEISKTIALPEGTPRSVACPLDPAQSAAYVFTDQKTYKIDIKRQEIVREWPNTLSEPVPNFDGSLMFKDHYGPVEVAEVGSRGWDHSGLSHKFKGIARFPFIDPRGRYIAIGKYVYAPDGSAAWGELEIKPEAASAKNAWLFGMHSDELLLASQNGGRIIKRFTLPKSWVLAPKTKSKNSHAAIQKRYLTDLFLATGSISWTAAFKCAVIADDLRDRLILVGPELYNIPYEAFDTPSEPDLILPPLPLLTGMIGQELTFEFPIQTDGAEVELLDGKNATLDGNMFRWTPSIGHAGRNVFHFLIKHGDISQPGQLVTEIHRVKTPSLPIDFHVTHIDLSADESKMAVAGYRVENAEESTAEVEKRTGQIAVIDTQSGEVIGQRSLGVTVLQVEFCRDEILIRTSQPGGTSRADRLQVPSLERVDQALDINGELLSFDDRLLGAYKGSNWTFYSLPAYRPLPAPSNYLRNFLLTGNLTAAGRIREGVLRDRQTGEPKMLFGSAPFAVNRIAQRILLQNSSPQMVFRGFFYQVSSTGLKFGAHIRRSATAAGTYDSIYLPATITKSVTNAGHDLVIRSIASGKEVGRHFLMERDESNPSPFALTDCAYSKQFIFAVVGGKIFRIDVAPLAERCPLPFQVEPIQQTFVLAGRSAKLKYHAPGAQSYRLKLVGLQEFTPVEMESATGEFVVKLPDMDESASYAWKMMPPANGKSTNPLEPLDRYKKLIEFDYKKITGRKPAGIPIAVSATITAAGPGFDTSTLLHYYLLEVPMSNMKRTIPKKRTRGTF